MGRHENGDPDWQIPTQKQHYWALLQRYHHHHTTITSPSPNLRWWGLARALVETWKSFFNMWNTLFSSCKKYDEPKTWFWIVWPLLNRFMVWGELLDKIEDDGCMEGLQNAAEFCRVAGSHFTGAGITAVQRWRWCGQCITISGISQLLSYYPCSPAPACRSNAVPRLL